MFWLMFVKGISGLAAAMALAWGVMSYASESPSQSVPRDWGTIGICALIVIGGACGAIWGGR